MGVPAAQALPGATNRFLGHQHVAHRIRRRATLPTEPGEHAVDHVCDRGTVEEEQPAMNTPGVELWAT